MTTRKATGRGHDLDHFNGDLRAYMKHQALREDIYLRDNWKCQIWICFCGRVYDFEYGKVPKNYNCSRCGLVIVKCGWKCKKTEIDQWNETRGNNGRGRTFDCHHINKMTDDNRKKNLLTSCSSCHRKLHPNRRWRRFAGKEE